MNQNKIGKLASVSAAALILAVSAGSANAQGFTDKAYVSGAYNYSQVDHAVNDAKGPGLEFHFGYILNASWNIELGYLDALAEMSSAPDYDGNALSGHGYDLNGVVLSVVGKAAMIEGELYYRAGIMQANIDSVTYFETGDTDFSCNAGVVSTGSLQWDETNYNFSKCEINDTKVVGLFGLGYKYNITDSWFFRTEIRRIFVRNDFNVDNVSLGLGYKF